MSTDNNSPHTIGGVDTFLKVNSRGDQFFLGFRHLGRILDEMDSKRQSGRKLFRLPWFTNLKKQNKTLASSAMTEVSLKQVNPTVSFVSTLSA